MRSGYSSDVEGEGVPVVPGLGKYDDDVQHGTTKRMARGRARLRPRAVARGDRSCGGGRQAPVEEGGVDLLHEKFPEEVREVHDDTGKNGDQKRAAEAHGGDRNLKNDGGGSADSGE